MNLGFIGISDPGIWLAYVGCILATVLCVAYGIINWNKGALEASDEDKKWAVEEEQIEKEFE